MQACSGATSPPTSTAGRRAGERAGSQPARRWRRRTGSLQFANGIHTQFHEHTLTLGVVGPHESFSGLPRPHPARQPISPTRKPDLVMRLSSPCIHLMNLGLFYPQKSNEQEKSGTLRAGESNARGGGARRGPETVCGPIREHTHSHKGQLRGQIGPRRGPPGKPGGKRHARPLPFFYSQWRGKGALCTVFRLLPLSRAQGLKLGSRLTIPRPFLTRRRRRARHSAPGVFLDFLRPRFARQHSRASISVSGFLYC